MRLALVIGHTIISGGAHSHTHVSEFEYNEELAGMVASNLADTDIEVLIMHRTTYAELPSQINERNPDLIISMHCNSYNTKVSGCEVLHYHKSSIGAKLATLFSENVAKCLQIKNRGAKPKSTEDRGGYLLKYTKATCIILEPFFIDNKEDFEKGIQLKNALALMLSELIVEVTNKNTV